MGILLDAMCRMREKEITFKKISLTTITKNQQLQQVKILCRRTICLEIRMRIEKRQ
jgi:hypothetical protein